MMNRIEKQTLRDLIGAAHDALLLLDTIGKTDSITAITLRNAVQRGRLIESGQTPPKDWREMLSTSDARTVQRIVMENRSDLAALMSCWRCAEPIGDAEYQVTEDGLVNHRECPKKEEY